MEDNDRITKIIVNQEDELTDIVNGILNAQTERIILTFTEPSDILISSINLSTIKEVADDEGKLLICQIIKNPTGERNSKIANIVTIDTPNNPTPELWDQAKEKKESITPKPIEQPAIEKVQPDNAKAPVEKNTSDFEKRINEAILKSRTEIEKKNELKTIQQEGVVISVGEDLPITEENEPDLSNIDFNHITAKPVSLQKHKAQFKFPKLFEHKTDVTDSPLKRKIRRFLPILLISVIAITILVGVIYYQTVPFVKVRIFVKSQEVSIEKTFTGDPNIKEIDFTNLRIPVKTETMEEARSSTITATGKAYKGEKAAGSVALTHPGKDASCTTLQLAAGQVIVSSDGKTYTLDNAVSIPCNSYLTTPVHATDIGEEYNTSSSYFNVQNYSDTEVFGYKSGEFSGGSKTEYTVLSLTDVNTASDELKASAIKEIEEKLKNGQGSEWTIITDSMKGDIKQDSLKTDIAVGAAATQANLTLTVTGSATYYLSNGFNQGIATLLTAEAQSKNLFQSDQNLELVLGDNIEKDVSVVQSTDTSVMIKLTAKGSVQPKIDKAKIISDLQNMSWQDGTKYLDNLKYSDKATVYEFNPVNFPKSMYHFPKKQGGILVEVVNI